MNPVCLMKNGHTNISLVIQAIKQCVYCHETIAVFKEYNLKQKYHETKHIEFGCKHYEEKCKKKFAECVTKLKKQQTLFTKQSTLQDSATEASFMIAYNLAKRNKPFFRMASLLGSVW